MRIKLGIPFSGLFGGKPITHITTDSREASEGDLFFPIKGKYQDGNNYTNDAISRGAYVAPFSLLKFASDYKKRLPRLIHTVAITGSVGKTTTKEFLRRISEKQYTTHATDGNYNNEIGLALSILTAPEETEVLILEMGANAPGEISRLSKCAEPSVAVITNVGSAHIGNFGSKEKIAEAKLEIRDGLGRGRLIVPYGEPLLSGFSDISYSSNSLWARVSLKTQRNGSVNLFIKGRHRLGAYFSLSGSHLNECLAAALAAADAIGVCDECIRRGIEDIDGSCIRHKIIKLDDFYIFDDCYNASLESVLATLNLFLSLGYKEKSVCLGDIYELGEHSEKIHREIGKAIAPSGISRLYLMGNECRFIMDEAIRAGFPAERIHCNADLCNPKATAREILSRHKKDEIVLFKASRAVGLERVIEYLKGVE